MSYQKDIWTPERRAKASAMAKKRFNDPKVRKEFSKTMKRVLAKKKKKQLASPAPAPTTKKVVVTPDDRIQGQAALLLTEIQRRDSMSRTEVLDQALLAYLEKYPVPRPKVVAPDPVREALSRIKKVNLFRAQEAQCPVNIVPPEELPAPKSESTSTGIKWMQEPLAEAAEMDLGGSYVE